MNTSRVYPFLSVNQFISKLVLAFLLSISLVACTSDARVETPAENASAPSLVSTTISSSNSNPDVATVGDTVTVTITASEAILAPTVLINGNAATSVTGSGTDWVATYVISETGTAGPLSVEINYSDVSGTPGQVVTSTTDGSTVSVDISAPTLSIEGVPSNAEAGVLFTVSFVFSEAVNGFDMTDIIATNATVSNFTGADGDTTYTADITPIETEQVDISVDAGVAVDISGNSSSEVLVSVPPKPVLILVWSDEFDGSALDASKWNIQTGDGCAEGICGWGNGELQIYQEANATVNGGMLTIEGRKESDGSYTSARLNTKGKMDIKYGRIEVNARLPEGQGTWPAIWMLPTDEVYGGWPLSGEIDIIEATNLGVDSKQTVTSTLHYGLPWPQNTYTYSAYEPGYDPQAGFHTYAIEWEANEIRFFVDDVHHATQISDNWYTYDVGSTTMAPNTAPFDQAFHLLLNLAIGGSLPGAVDDSILPQQLVVDYVRVYECANSDPDTGEGCTTADPSVVPVSAPGAPSVHQLEIYTDTAPATISAEVSGVTSTNTLQPGGFNNGGATVISEFDFVDPDNAANSVWHLAISGDLANVFLSSEDKSGDEILDTGFNLMGGQDLGELIFDMKVNTLSAGTDILIKMDSGFPDVGQVTLADVTVGDWQSYSVKIADLIANPAFVDCCGGTGLNLATVLNLFVFEPANADLAAIDVDVYLDNIRVEVACKDEGACFAEAKTKPLQTLTVYDDAVGATWDAGIGGFDDATGFASCFDGASCGGIVSWAEVAATDATRGQVIEFTHAEGTNFAGEFIQSTVPRDLSAFDSGTLSFDIQVLNAGNNTSGFVMKVDCVFPCTSGDKPIGVVGASGWETVTIPVSELIATGLDTSNVNTGLVIFPVAGQQSGVVYQIDNIYWDIGGTAGTPLSSDTPSAGVTIDGEVPPVLGSDINVYSDGFNMGYSANFFAADGSVNITEVAATDSTYGTVLQIEALASQQVSWIAADPLLDLTAYAGGTLEFDMLVTQSPTDPTAKWLIKSECDGCGAGTELVLGGQTVLTKDTWHHVSVAIDSLALADLSMVNNLMVVFPDWGKSTGAIYQIDNVRFHASGVGTGPALSDDPTSAGISLNPSVSTSGGAEEVVYIDGLSAGYETGSFGADGAVTVSEVTAADASHGTVIQIDNNTTSQAVAWVGANPAKDLSAYADGVLEFDIFVVDAPNNPNATWRMKVECTDCTATELTIGGQTLLPPGEWHHVVAEVPSLAITDLTQVTNIVVFNDWTQAAGSVYQLDNIVWKESNNVVASKVLFDEALATGYEFAQYDNWFTGTVTMQAVDSMDTEHGMVVEINNGTSQETVSWIGGPATDLTPFADGTLSFDIYVVTAPGDATADYLVKIESEPCPAGCTGGAEYVIGTQADIPPGSWQSISINVADLGVTDITTVRNVVFFNNWGKAAGSVFRIDNVQFNP